MNKIGQQIQGIVDNKHLTSKKDRQAITRVAIRYCSILFQGIQNEIIDERSTALEKIESTVSHWVKECYPPGLAIQAMIPEANTIPVITTNNNTSIDDISIKSDNTITTETTKTIEDNNTITNDDNNTSQTFSNDNVKFDNPTTPLSSRSSVSEGSVENLNAVPSPLFSNESTSATASSAASPTPTGDGVLNPSPHIEVAATNTLNVNNNDSPNLGLQRDNNIRRNLLDEENDIENAGEILRLLILTMLRMSIDCPFADVRQTFQEYLIKLKNIGVPVPIPIHSTPSKFIPPEDMLTLEWSPHSRNPSFDNDEDEVSQPTPSPTNTPTIVGQQPDDLIRELMIKTFIRIGRLSHYYRVLSYFPRFMEKYQNSYSAIVESPGPLRRSDRYYIGIMAASQHKSQYLISKLKNYFLLHGGDAEWLEGLQYASVKIRKLAQINSILAHQPWRLQKSHIHELIRGSPNPLDNWAVPEVVHIILVLCTFHSLSSFVISCGIVPEYDCLGGYQNDEETIDSSLGIHDSSHQTSQEVAKGIGITLNNITTEPIPIITEETADESINETTTTTTEATVEKLINETTESESSLQSSPSEKPPTIPVFLRANNFSLYLDPNVDIKYDDFSFDSEEYSPLMLRDYSWSNQGVLMVNKYLPSVDVLNVGEVLNEEFSEIKVMTDYSLFRPFISDVSPFRHQIWVYVQGLLGIQDDYPNDDNDDEQPLNDDTKNYLKKVCTTPELITEDDWKNINYQRTEEKCLLNLIAVEARKQSELLYGLWNVMRWTDKR
ncbi:hypothetical protein Glove_209g126 [Diversispora epigaea]|uniref:Sestrin n=1 Tax=Diversispora epigaea TaxID=1348612 RepID=A0A397IIV8_9GLOM|nr:hypothetical protein Glove_209g126 [Diversispora epigaea]